MWVVWQSLGESLYFFRRHFFRLAGVLLPVALPVFLGTEYRACVVLHSDDKLVGQDVALVMVNALLGLFALAITLQYAVTEVDGQRQPTLRILRRALFAVPSLLALQLLMFLGLIAVSMLKAMPVLLLLVMVPGLWLLACLMPASVYIVAERQPIPEALRSSFSNFRGIAWQLMAALMIVSLGLFLPVVAGSAALMACIDKLPSLPLRMLLGSLVDAMALLLSQFWPVLLVRYYDMRRQAAMP